MSSSSTSTPTASTSPPTTTTPSPITITPTTLSTTLKQKLEASHIDIEDTSGGCGQSFHAIIVSPLFSQKNSLARHRLVNAALKAEIASIHAWTPKCFTPEEWEKRGG